MVSATRNTRRFANAGQTTGTIRRLLQIVVPVTDKSLLTEDGLVLTTENNQSLTTE